MYENAPFASVVYSHNEMKTFHKWNIERRSEMIRRLLAHHLIIFQNDIDIFPIKMHLKKSIWVFPLLWVCKFSFALFNPYRSWWIFGRERSIPLQTTLFPWIEPNSTVSGRRERMVSAGLRSICSVAMATRCSWGARQRRIIASPPNKSGNKRNSKSVLSSLFLKWLTMERISETFLESVLSMLKRAVTISSAVGSGLDKV